VFVFVILSGSTSYRKEALDYGWRLLISAVREERNNDDDQ
jgi:hypothetical protein